jgi:hypothetical protein
MGSKIILSAEAWETGDILTSRTMKQAYEMDKAL